MGTLEGRRAVITGASSGIGEATAVAIAHVGVGAPVVPGARRKDRLDELGARRRSDRGLQRVNKRP